MATIKKTKGIKKAQAGDTTKPKRVVTEKDLYEKFIPSNRQMMTGVGPSKTAIRTNKSDSILKQRIKEGLFTQDPKSGDIFPTEKYYKPGRKVSGELKKGGKVAAKKAVVKKVVKKAIKKSVKKK